MVSKCSVRNPGLTRFRYRKLRSIKPAPHNKSSARPLRRPQGRFVAAGLAHPARRLAGVPKRALGLRPRCFERGDGADEKWWPAWPPQPRKRKPGHSGIRADAQSKGEDADTRDQRTAEELAKPKAKVIEKIFGQASESFHRSTPTYCYQV